MKKIEKPVNKILSGYDLRWSTRTRNGDNREVLQTRSIKPTSFAARPKCEISIAFPTIGNTNENYYN